MKEFTFKWHAGDLYFPAFLFQYGGQKVIAGLQRQGRGDIYLEPLKGGELPEEVSIELEWESSGGGIGEGVLRIPTSMDVKELPTVDLNRNRDVVRKVKNYIIPYVRQSREFPKWLKPVSVLQKSYPSIGITQNGEIIQVRITGYDIPYSGSSEAGKHLLALKLRDGRWMVWQYSNVWKRTSLSKREEEELIASSRDSRIKFIESLLESLF